MLYLENNASEKASVEHRYAENVPGPFYVDNQCLDCDVCRYFAPSNFTRQDDSGYSFVYKQPENIEELLACIEVLQACPCVAIGIDGGPLSEQFPEPDLILFKELQKTPTSQAIIRYMDQSRDLNTAFRLAARYNFFETLSQLLDLGADINGQSASNGSTALMYAVEHRNLGMVQFLIDHNANVQLCNHIGDNVIDACPDWKNRAEIYQLLLTAGARPKKGSSTASPRTGGCCHHHPEEPAQ